MKLTSAQLSTLIAMLTYCRPAGSRTDDQFRDQYLYSIPECEGDAFGNLHVRIGSSRVLWSAHTDTVHRMDGRQRVHFDGETIRLHKKSKRNCLGADDTVGVFLLTEMIKARVPGYYIFHFAEEIGGLGSKDLADKHGDWLSEQFDFAIALDRGGISDVVTHQFGERTCSTVFALSLAKQLPGTFKPCHGIYTDTAEYSDHIPECTNVSVGYSRAHSPDESINVSHVGRLLYSLLSFDPSLLVVGDKYKEALQDVRRERVTWKRWEKTTRTPQETTGPRYRDLLCPSCNEPGDKCVCSLLSRFDR